MIRGDNVTTGYLSPQEANAGAFATGWFRTGDLGFIDSAGYLYLTGRLKEIINRGGEKVSPFEVDQALVEHGAVRQAATFGVRHATLGEDARRRCGPAGWRDGNGGTDPRAFLFGRLAEFKIPSRVVVVTTIPVSTTGKVQRTGLADRLAQQLQPAHVAPRDEMEREVAAMFGKVLGVTTAGALDNFFALGGDSLRGFQLLTRIRAHMHVDVSILDLFREPTVAQVAALVARAQQEAERIELERIIGEVEGLSDEAAGRLVHRNKSHR